MPKRIVGCIVTMFIAVGRSQLATPQQSSSTTPAVTQYRAVLDKYCVTCHNEKLKTGGLTLDKLSLENIPAEGPWANLVFLTYFNAGLRAVDVSDPLRPKEVGHYVPQAPDGQEAIQSNDIGADAEGRLYLIDRWGAGMHILEYMG